MANELSSVVAAAATGPPVYRRHDGSDAARMAQQSSEQAAESQQTQQVGASAATLRLLPDVHTALEQVARGGGQVAVAALKHVLEQNPDAAVSAATQVVEALQQATCPTQHVEACRMVRAMCLAGCVQHLEAAGAHTVLLQLLTDPSPGSRALAATATEALLSCALRSACVGAAVKALPVQQARHLVQLLQPRSSTNNEGDHVPITGSQPFEPTAATADATTARPLSSTLIPAGASGSGSSLGSNAPDTALLHSMLRLMTSLVNNASALPALLAAGLLQALLQLAVTAAEPAEGTDVSSGSPGSKGSAGVSDGSSTSAHASKQQQASARDANAWQGIQTSALGFLLKFSQYPQLHSHLVAAGAGQQLTAVLKLGTPAAVLEPAVCILSNLAHGSPACQARLVSAGVIKPLVALLAVKHAGVVCSTADALANLVLHNQSAQRQLGTARCTFPDVVQPNLLGKAQVAAAAAAGTGDGSDSSNTATNGIAGLVRLLQSGSVPLMVKVLRALGNAVLGCAANQNLFLATGGLPALLVMCEVPSTAKQAVGLLTNLLPGCEAARKAALAAGLPAVLARLLSRTHAPPSQEVAVDAVQQTAAGADSNAAVVACDEVMERSCLLAANLAAGGQAAKSALVEAGVLQQLLVLLQEATAAGSRLYKARQEQGLLDTKELSSWMRVAAAAAGAVSNFVLKYEDVAEKAVQWGAVTTLLQLAKVWQQVDGAADVLSRAVHALGSMVAQSNVAKAAALKADVHVTLITFSQGDDVASNVAVSCCRALTHLTLSSPTSQAAVAQQNGVQCMLRLMQQAHISDELLGAVLSAVASMCQGCSAAQLQFLNSSTATNGPALLVARLDAASNAASTVSLACACVHALACPVDAHHKPDRMDASASAASSMAVLGDVGSLLCGGDDARQEAARATIHQVQESLAAAGALTALVALLRARQPQLVDAAAMALCALLSGNRSCQKTMAGAGGVGQLAALLDRVDAASRPALARHIVDAWLELGGATAVVKLLSHTQPLVVELACRRIAACVLALAGQHAASSAMHVASSCTWLVGAGWWAASANTSPLSAAIARLTKAGAPAVLLRTCHLHAQPRVVAAALLALRALLQAGNDRVRPLLIEAGAEQCLQQLQQAATVAAEGGMATAGLGSLQAGGQAKGGITQRMMRAKPVPHAFSVASPGGLQLSSSPLFVGTSPKQVFPSKTMAAATGTAKDVGSGGSAADRKPKTGLPPKSKPAASNQQAKMDAARDQLAGLVQPGLNKPRASAATTTGSHASVHSKRSTSPPVTTQQIAMLAQQIYLQLMS